MTEYEAEVYKRLHRLSPSPGGDPPELTLEVASTVVLGGLLLELKQEVLSAGVDIESALKNRPTYTADGDLIPMVGISRRG